MVAVEAAASASIASLAKSLPPATRAAVTIVLRARTMLRRRAHGREGAGSGQVWLAGSKGIRRWGSSIDLLGHVGGVEDVRGIAKYPATMSWPPTTTKIRVPCPAARTA